MTERIYMTVAVILGIYWFGWMVLCQGKEDPGKKEPSEKPNEPEKNEKQDDFLTTEFLKKLEPLKGDDRPTDEIENPPYPTAIKAVSSLAIAKKYQIPIAALMNHSGLNEVEANTMLLPAIEDTIRIVHMLPASEQDHHSYEGGLLTHSLEVALNAAIAAQNHIFDEKEYPAQKYENRKRWVLAAILAGLAHDFGKVIDDIQVINAETHRRKRMDILMRNWIVNTQVKSYSISWRSGNRSPKSHQEGSFFLLRSILSDAIVNFLCFKGNPHIYKALRDAVYNQSGPLGSILANADGRSAREDREHRKKIGIGFHSIITQDAGAFCRGISHLVETNAWSVNEKDSNVFITSEGVFLRWQSDAKALEQMLRQIANASKEADATNDPQTNPQIILGTLINGRALVKRDGEGYPWVVCPITLESTYIRCLRFQSPELLLGSSAIVPFIEAHVFGIAATGTQQEAWLKRYGAVPTPFFANENKAEAEETAWESIRSAIHKLGVQKEQQVFNNIQKMIEKERGKVEEAPAKKEGQKEEGTKAKRIEAVFLDSPEEKPKAAAKTNPTQEKKPSEPKDAPKEEQAEKPGKKKTDEEPENKNPESPQETDAILSLIKKFLSQLEEGHGELLGDVRTKGEKRISSLANLLQKGGELNLREGAILYHLDNWHGIQYDKTAKTVAVRINP